MTIAIAVAQSDLSTFILELRAIEDTRFASVLMCERPYGPKYTIELYEPSEGATDEYKAHPQFTAFARDEAEATRLFSEATGGCFVEPEAFRERMI